MLPILVISRIGGISSLLVLGARKHSVFMLSCLFYYTIALFPFPVTSTDIFVFYIFLIKNVPKFGTHKVSFTLSFTII